MFSDALKMLQKAKGAMYLDTKMVKMSVTK